MQGILIYDTDAEAIEKISYANDITVAEVVEMLMEYADKMIKDNNLQ